ncbi:MAG: D-alanyl-D-alanine carboxypeptidase, partial [Clostridia bacterium]
GNVEFRTEMKEISLPIKKGQTVARLYMFSQGEFLGGVSLNADRNLDKDDYKDYIIKITKELM